MADLPTPDDADLLRRWADGLLSALQTVHTLTDGTIFFLPDATDLLYEGEFREPDEIPGLWGQAITASGVPATVPLTVVVCTGPETTPLLLNIASHPRAGEVIRVQDRAWWPLSHPHGCPAAGYPLPSDLLPELLPDDDPQTIQTLGRRDPADLLEARGRALQEATRALAEGQFPHSLGDHAEAEREARTDGPHQSTTACLLGLLIAIRDPGCWATFLTWDDDGAWRLWLELIPLAPPGYRAPVAALIAHLALQRGAPHTAQLAAQQGLEDTAGQNPEIRRVLEMVRDVVRTTDELIARIEELLDPPNP